MIRNLKQINAYREFQNAAGINQVRLAVLGNVPPAGLTPAQTNRFTQKYLNGDWVVVPIPQNKQGSAGHPNSRLKYRPTQNINLLVAYPDERQNFMDRIWKDRKRGLGLGLQAFYSQVAMSHLNIQKAFTDDFLMSKGNYQIQKVPIRKSIIKPIVAKSANERFGMDLIDMSFGPVAHRTERYIITVVDYFSGYLWARRLTNRTAQTIVTALTNIINTPAPNGSAGTFPHFLQSDNGAEFRNAIMAAFCAANQIQHIFSTSFHPRSNGKVERKNREVRKKIKAGFIRQNQHNWNATMLRDYVQNINSQPNQKSKMTPKQLWTPGFNPVAAGPLPAIPALANNNNQAQLNLINRNYQQVRAVRLTHGALPTFQIGDLVRVSMFLLSAQYRRAYKDHIGTNKIAVNWSPVVSRVLQVYPVNAVRLREMYSITVGPTTGNPPPVGQNNPLMKGAIHWLFAGNELTSAGDQVSIAPRTIPRSNFMNSRN
jgi:transposase InsO family protein